MVELEGEGLARLRQSLYRFFAISLLYPEETRLRALEEVVAAVEEHELAPFAFHRAWSDLRQALRSGIDRERAEKEYVRLFSVGTGGALCPPHESYYLATPGRAAAAIAVELETEYRRLGLAMSPEARTLPDHVAVEMEAMAFMCGEEAEAWESRSLSRAAEILEQERSFMNSHLGKWFPLFSRCVLQRGEGFYAAVVAAADAFIKHDMDLLNVLTAEVSARV
jgi:anaerobic sulfite reductase subunit A